MASPTEWVRVNIPTEHGHPADLALVRLPGEADSTLIIRLDSGTLLALKPREDKKNAKKAGKGASEAKPAGPSTAAKVLFKASEGSRAQHLSVINDQLFLLLEDGRLGRLSDDGQFREEAKDQSPADGEDKGPLLSCHEHPVAEAPQDMHRGGSVGGKWTCAKCSMGFVGKTFRYVCAAGCDFDVCRRCFNSELKMALPLPAEFPCDNVSKVCF